MLQTYPLINYNGLSKRKDSCFKKLVSQIKDGMTVEEMTESKFYKKLIRKMRKTEYIEKNYQNFEFKSKGFKPKHLINHFTVEYDYDYWKNVYVFDTNDIESVINDLEILGVEREGSTWTSPYDCTGRTFYQPSILHLLSDRIIVTQTGALDV